MINRIESKDKLEYLLKDHGEIFIARKRLRHTMGSPWDGPYIKGQQDCIERFPSREKETINHILDIFSSYTVVLLDDTIFFLKDENQIAKVENELNMIKQKLIEENYRFYDI